jgi:hypothetical protein
MITKTERAIKVKTTVSIVSGATWRPDTMDGLKEMARNHWAHFRPKMFQRLSESGMLEDLLDKAVQFTREDMKELQRQLTERGYTDTRARETAWERLKQKWILLPKER